MLDKKICVSWPSGRNIWSTYLTVVFFRKSTPYLIIQRHTKASNAADPQDWNVAPNNTFQPCRSATFAIFPKHLFNSKPRKQFFSLDNISRNCMTSPFRARSNTNTILKTFALVVTYKNWPVTHKWVPTHCLGNTAVHYELFFYLVLLTWCPSIYSCINHSTSNINISTLN